VNSGGFTYPPVAEAADVRAINKIADRKNFTNAAFIFDIHS
jgi:hypothetical protein